MIENINVHSELSRIYINPNDFSKIVIGIDINLWKGNYIKEKFAHWLRIFGLQKIIIYQNVRNIILNNFLNLGIVPGSMKIAITIIYPKLAKIIPTFKSYKFCNNQYLYMIIRVFGNKDLIFYVSISQDIWLIRKKVKKLGILPNFANL